MSKRRSVDAIANWPTKCFTKWTLVSSRGGAIWFVRGLCYVWGFHQVLMVVALGVYVAPCCPLPVGSQTHGWYVCLCSGCAVSVGAALLTGVWPRVSGLATHRGSSGTPCRLCAESAGRTTLSATWLGSCRLSMLARGGSADRMLTFGRRRRCSNARLWKHAWRSPLR